MADSICPGCKSSKYNNPQLKLLVNLCGHFLCESCVEIMFVRGSGLCPECKTPLRRNNFRQQLFECSTVEKEVDIRRKILKDFNKRQEDFSSLDEYNNYLEFVEEIIFNLANSIDVEETKQRIEDYKTANKDKIKKNRSRHNIDIDELNMLIMEEEELKKKFLEDDNKVLENRKKQRQIKEEMIDDLMTSSASASTIVAQHASLITESSNGDNKSDELLVKKESAIDTIGKSFIKYASLRDKAKSTGSTISMEQLPTVTAAPFVYSEYRVDMLGPSVPDNVDEQASILMNTLWKPMDDNYLKSGFSQTDWATILVQKAYCGLFL